jgi:hypothetical protein
MGQSNLVMSMVNITKQGGPVCSKNCVNTLARFQWRRFRRNQINNGHREKIVFNTI